MQQKVPPYTAHSCTSHCTQCYILFLLCRFEDYVGQLEAATAIAGLSVEKGHTPGVKDRKEIAAFFFFFLATTVFFTAGVVPF